MKDGPEQLISWLKYLDVEYLDDEICRELATLDVNNVDDQDKIITLAIIPEFAALNDISKGSMRRLLEGAAGFPEAEVMKLLTRVGMPFGQDLRDYKAFFERVRRRIEGIEAKS